MYFLFADEVNSKSQQTRHLRNQPVTGEYVSVFFEPGLGSNACSFRGAPFHCGLQAYSNSRKEQPGVSWEKLIRALFVGNLVIYIMEIKSIRSIRLDILFKYRARNRKFRGEDSNTQHLYMKHYLMTNLIANYRQEERYLKHTCMLFPRLVTSLRNRLSHDGPSALDPLLQLRPELQGGRLVLDKCRIFVPINVEVLAELRVGRSDE